MSDEKKNYSALFILSGSKKTKISYPHHRGTLDRERSEVPGDYFFKEKLKLQDFQRQGSCFQMKKLERG